MKELFKEKYLKYSPEITLEVFTLVCNKLIESGINLEYSIEWHYDKFKGHYQYLLIPDGRKDFSTWACSSNRKETTVQEILGYDLFVKDDFVLPEKWCCEINYKSREIFNKWRKTKARHLHCEMDATYTYIAEDGSCNHSKINTEITFEQFQKYVLKTTEQPKVMEKDWSKATEEELLEEAKRRYPIGCKVKLIGRNIGGDYKDEVRFTKYTVYNTSKGKELFVDGNLLLFDKTWAEIVSLPETKIESNEVIPEYVECIDEATCNTKIGEIFKCRLNEGNFEWKYNNKSILGYDSWDGWIEKWGSKNSLRCFKPSTKEAFDAQNQPKPIEKWSVGSYVVPLQNKLLTRYEPLIKGKPYQIIRLTSVPYIMCEKGIEINFSGNSYTETTEGIKWFATKSEAEEFAKTLIQPVKEEIKQPLKQAVHCKTQEEWDFVLSKFNENGLYTSQWNTYEEESCISLFKDDLRDGYTSCNHFKIDRTEIVSFQEWCDLNGYKMKKEVKFEVGKYYRFNISKNKSSLTRTIRFARINKDGNIVCDLWMRDSGTQFNIGRNSWGETNVNNPIELSLEEIQQYLPDGHPDKIKSNDFRPGDWVIVIESKSRFSDIDKAIGYIFQIRGDGSYYEDFMSGSDQAIDRDCKYCINYNKSNIRHATLEEINNHLISIGQIPAGEPLNTGIEPNKDGMFKYTTCTGTTHVGKTSTISEPLKPGDLEWKIQVPQIKTHGIMWCESAPMTKDNWKPKMILSIDDEELPMVSIIKTNSIKQLLNLE